VRERSLASYLLLPRPGDLIKAWIFPAGFLLGVLAAEGASGGEVLRAALIWAALELLIYQARYQWNDIRGFEADQRHPDRVARGRLPGPASKGRERIRASVLVAAGRLGLAAVLALVLSGLDLGAPLLALAAAVFGVAVLYEFLRSRATGGGDRVPSPLSAGILALWAVVGGGYAIRGVAGLATAVDLFDDPWLLAAAVLAFWAFGIAFVTGRWALEALAFGRGDGRGGIEWRAEPGQAREHTLALVRWLPAQGPPAVERRTDGALDDWRALAGGSSPLAPWNLAAMVAAAAAALSGRLLAGPADLLDGAVAAGVGAVCAAVALGLGRSAFPGRSASSSTAPPLSASPKPSEARRHWPAWLLGGAGLVAVMAATGSPRPLLAALPWLCIVGAHLFFAAQSPRTLAHPLRSALADARSRRAPSPPPASAFVLSPDISGERTNARRAGGDG
jgi:hypothetical protein